jgi:hypothetical protein
MPDNNYCGHAVMPQNQRGIDILVDQNMDVNSMVDTTDVVNNYHVFETLEIDGNVETITFVPIIIKPLSLSSEIKALQASNNFRKRLNDVECNVLINDLINAMSRIGMNVDWLEEVNAQPIVVTLKKEAITVPAASWGITKNNEYLLFINVNENSFANVREWWAQAVVLHELRHISQRTSREWQSGEKLRWLQGNDILIEVDAFDVQYEFERKMGIPMGGRQSYRPYFEHYDNVKKLSHEGRRMGKANILWNTYKRHNRYSNSYGWSA